MKAFWDNLFYDMDKIGGDRTKFVNAAGEDIKNSLVRIDNEIKNHNPKKAMSIIKQCINDY